MIQTDGSPLPEANSKSVAVPGGALWFGSAGGSRSGSQSMTQSGPQPGTDPGLVAQLRPRDWPRQAIAPWSANRITAPSSDLTPEALSPLVHDARNMVSALELYCDLLEEPGVLNAPYRHYAAELRRVGAANRRLLEALSQLDKPGELPIFPDPAAPRTGEFPLAARLRARWQPDPKPVFPVPVAMDSSGMARVANEAATPAPAGLARNGRRQVFISGQPVENLAEELRANRNLLAAMVGHGVTLGMSIRGGACPIAMAGDDLTRVLVNLARNATEAMAGSGHLQIALEEGPEYLTLSFTDSGPGIPPHALESIFSPGYSTHVGVRGEGDGETSAWPVQHRGLGLSIVRSLVAAAGGAVWAANHIGSSADLTSAPDPGAELDVAIPDNRVGAFAESPPPRGAVFLLEFPLPAAGG